MPSEAIEAGAVDEVVALENIAAALERRIVKVSRLAPVGVR
jgi:chemotaxis response regulator CheB